jgi:hypothetical protein
MMITDWGESRTVEACGFTRPMREFSAETVGLSLDDGKKLLQTVHRHVGLLKSVGENAASLLGLFGLHGCFRRDIPKFLTVPASGSNPKSIEAGKTCLEGGTVKGSGAHFRVIERSSQPAARLFKLQALHSTPQAQLDPACRDSRVRTEPCGCGAAARCQRS